MKTIGHNFLFRVICACALVIWITGCSSGGDDDVGFFSSGGDGVVVSNPTGTVVINQQFLGRELPAEVARERFLGFNASDVLVFGSVEKNRATTITLEEVPVTVTSLQMQLLDSNDIVIDGTLDFSGVSLEAGGSISLVSEADLEISSTGKVLSNGDGDVGQGAGADAGHISLFAGSTLLVDGSLQCVGDRAESNFFENGESGDVTLSSAGDLQVGASGQIVCNGRDGINAGGTASSPPSSGRDGGNVALSAGNTLTFSGTVCSEGGDGGDNDILSDFAFDGASGGSGGQVELNGIILVFDGSLKLSGGRGSDGGGGELQGSDNGATGGDGGATTLVYGSSITLTGATIETLGGDGGTPGSDGADGQDGVQIP